MWEDSPLSNGTSAESSKDGYLAPTPPSPRGSSREPSPTRSDSGGKNIKRRSHRKSRLGCQNCKTRRIKCDERRPECTNCKKRQVRCDYVVESSTPHAFNSEPSGSAASARLNVSDIELTYHWTTSTCHTLSAWNSGATYWKCNITELGLTHHHLLHLILCLTALHLAFARPSRRDEYIALADRHYALALPVVTQELTHINQENCDAVLTSVQLICFIHWARGPKPGEYLAFGHSGRSEWLIMFRGIRTTLTSMGHTFFTRTHALNARSRGVTLPPNPNPPDFEQPLADLKAHIPNISISPSSDIRSVDILVEHYHKRFDGTDGEYHVAFGWLYKQHEDFLTGLQRHDPAPLIIYAYFTVLMNEMERFWYIKGWTHHVMGGIYSILPDEHRIWIRWPMAEVGYIPP
ncbi:hypothetical protein BDV96DRAFT_579546 [Lophiotrema nucula]|uniref:Zn(2)-C6 fungal-type domain-containing protein n=1 Tax=Lophiotrema nucula TaxID=690887 RepID=A0A6A5Z0P4_9PLEO|nr:hypothetical protein BDV96DRAFT_579546 [Lophiotrema nucula]